MDCSPAGSSSMGFPGQEYWSGLPCPPPEDLPDSGTKPTSVVSPALAGRFFTTSATWEAQVYTNVYKCKVLPVCHNSAQMPHPPGSPPSSQDLNTRPTLTFLLESQMQLLSPLWTLTPFRINHQGALYTIGAQFLMAWTAANWKCSILKMALNLEV